MMLGKIMKGAAFLYLAGGVIALLMIPASIYGWLGVTPDPLSVIFALLFGLPWTLALRFFAEVGTVVAFLVSAIGIALNSALLLWLSRKASG